MNPGEQAALEHGTVMARAEEASPVGSSPAQQCTLLKFAVEKSRSGPQDQARGSGRGVGVGARGGSSEVPLGHVSPRMWAVCGRPQTTVPVQASDRQQSTSPLHSTVRKSPQQPGGVRQPAHDVRLLLFLVHVIWPPGRLASSPPNASLIACRIILDTERWCTTSKPRTYSASVHLSLFSAVQPLPVPRIRLSLDAALCTVCAPVLQRRSRFAIFCRRPCSFGASCTLTWVGETGHTGLTGRTAGLQGRGFGRS